MKSTICLRIQSCAAEEECDENKSGSEEALESGLVLHGYAKEEGTAATLPTRFPRRPRVVGFAGICDKIRLPRSGNSSYYGFFRGWSNRWCLSHLAQDSVQVE